MVGTLSPRGDPTTGASEVGQSMWLPRNCRAVVFATALMLGMGARMTMAQEADSTAIKALQEKTALLEQQKHLLEAERLRLEEERKLQEVQAGTSAAVQEAKRLQEETSLLNEKRNLINAYAPSLPTGLQGNISIGENQSIEANAAAYRTMRALVQVLVDSTVSPKVPPQGTVVFLSTDDQNALNTSYLFSADALLLKKAYEHHMPALEFVGVPELLIGVGALAKTASDIMALFRTDTEIKARSVTIPDEALIAECALRLPASTRYYLSGFPVYAVVAEPSLEILQSLEKARQDARERHQKELARLNSTKVTEERDKAANAATKQRLEARWSELETAFASFMQALRTRDAATGTTPMAQIVRGQWLREQLSREGTIGVTLRVLQAGGTYVIRKSFWKKAKLRQSGGIIIEYFLFDNTGKVLASGTADRVCEFPDLNVPQ